MRLRYVLGRDMYHLYPKIDNLSEWLEYKLYNKGISHKYIDKFGNLFRYTPTTYYPVRYRKIVRVKRMEAVGCAIFVEHRSTPYVYRNYVQAINSKFIEVVTINNGDFICGMYSQEGKRKRLKV